MIETIADLIEVLSELDPEGVVYLDDSEHDFESNPVRAFKLTKAEGYLTESVLLTQFDYPGKEELGT